MGSKKEAEATVIKDTTDLTKRVKATEKDTR